MPAETTMVLPQGEITFLGRGRGVLRGRNLILLVCPLCSQRNGRRGVEKGVCEWCCYVPSLTQAEPAQRHPERHPG